MDFFILSKTRHVKSILEYMEVFSKVSKLIVSAFPLIGSLCCVNFASDCHRGVSKWQFI